MDKAELKTALNLGKAAQIGCVVRNVSETIKHYEETIGIGPFNVVDFRPEKSFIKGRQGNAHSGIVHNPGELSGLTHIEANVSPVENTSEGIIVVDGSVPNFGIGVVETPIELTIKKGLITEIRGGKEAQFLKDILESVGDPLVYNIGQISVGLNPECKRLNGVMSNDHGSYGRMHFGIGTSHQLGGAVKAPIHFDVVIEAPTLSFDGEIVIRDGQILVEG